MSEADGQAEIVAFLARLAGRPPVETHISRVFVGRDTVWKLRKPVRLSFLDFSSLAARERYSRRELALNAPHAPGLYRDVVPVTRAPDGRLALGGAGEVVDWVVRMAPVPAEDFLDRVAARGALTPTLLDALGDAVAAMHGALPAMPGVDAVAAMARVIAGNARAAEEAGLAPAAVGAWRAAAEARHAALAPWLNARARDGFVRRAHGDLHLGNLCLWQGRPVPFDALEFDEDLATIDLGYDLAFLLMDLEARADRAAANRVLNRYVARTGDVALTRGLPLWLSCRAMVRAHVLARLGAEEAARYLAFAQAALDPPPPCLVAIGGLQGTGKTTLARALAPALGAAPGALILRTDEIRKRLAGLAPEERLPQDAYTRAATEAVYAALEEAAATALAGGHAAIADAVFLDPAERARIAAIATAAGVAFRGLWLDAPLAVLEARLMARQGDASDADVAVLRQAAARDPGPIAWARLDAAAPDMQDRARSLIANP
ncbi:AAA family ATPase [Elioraea tepidiphila]|uniref:bifunctional aminoglycoside phosphotransferase/ATP-binding protein n=1 Tax=Elioraea tepidiphila TaxID=457934 RepID=UPI0003634FB2|nr:AAA family ATPase [Elioraea tepidiphila]